MSIREKAHLCTIDLTNSTSDTFIDIIAKDAVTSVTVETAIAFMMARSIFADSANRGTIVIAKSTFINITTCNFTITSVSSITKTLMIALKKLIGKSSTKSKKLVHFRWFEKALDTKYSIKS